MKEGQAVITLNTAKVINPINGLSEIFIIVVLFREVFLKGSPGSRTVYPVYLGDQYPGKTYTAQS